jgi:hypothetical protein
MNSRYGWRGGIPAAVLFLSPVQGVWAQNGDPVPLPRLVVAPQIDGRPDPEAWRGIAPIALTTYQPVFGSAPSEDSEIRVGHDGIHLYVAARLHDSEPSGVRVNSLYRDRVTGDDVLGLVLDSFGDNQSALWFQVNAAGVRVDQAIGNDAEGQAAFNPNWNTYWDAHASQDSLGWYTEIRIPLSSLGFQTTGGDITMGLIVYRLIARKNEIQVYPAIRPDWSRGYLKPSQAQKVSLSQVRSSTPVYLTPYLLGGVTETTTPSPGDQLVRGDTLRKEAGLDIKYNVTNNLTLDLTVNTDFAQVEVDDQQVNLTRFSLFFPEKRQFFQERSALFDFPLGFGPFSDRVFHTRQIGLTPGGEPVRILGGGRLVGRHHGWDVGVLNLQAASHDTFPSENFGTLRVKRTAFNPHSYVGGILTSRVSGRSTNVVAGLDGMLRIGGNDYLIAKWVHTLADPVLSGDSAGMADAGLGMVRYERRTTLGINYDGQIVWSGSRFRPGLGFVTRSDYTHLQGRVAYGWLRTSGSLLTSSIGAFTQAFRRNGDGSLETAQVAGFWNLGWRSGASINFQSPGLQVEDLVAPLRLPGNVTVPAGRYTYMSRAGMFISSPPGSRARSTFFFAAGGFHDGWLVTAQATPTLNLSRRVALSGDYRVDRGWFPSRDEAFTVHIARARAQIAFDAKSSIDAQAQYNSATRMLVPSVRFRHNLREGNDLWIVVNETLERTGSRPQSAPTTRTAVVKFTYTFRT